MTSRAINARMFFTPVSPYEDAMRQAGDLIKFHRQTFGGCTMMADDDGVSAEQVQQVAEAVAQGAAAGAAAGATAESSSDLGFPADTPLAEMTEDQRNAYHRHMREQNKQRAREWKAVTGDRTPEQLRAELDELNRLRTERMTDAERAVEAAREEGRRLEAAKFAPRLARMAFEGALSHVDEDRRKVLLDTIDLSKVITEDGDVDTDKVRTLAATLAPGKGEAGHDFGAGRRGNGSSSTKSGVAAGAALFEARKKPTPTT